MTDWERSAYQACASHRSHIDYDDLLAVARIAAWKDQRHSYVAARSAVLEYLRGPQNRSRIRTRYGTPLPEPVPWDGSEVAQLTAEDNPERLVVAQIWCEWLLTHPCLSPAERKALSLFALTGENRSQISRQLKRPNGYIWWAMDQAAKKLRRVLAGDYVPQATGNRRETP